MSVVVIISIIAVIALAWFAIVRERRQTLNEPKSRDAMALAYERLVEDVTRRRLPERWRDAGGRLPT
jgi:Tfp pilus assembly protein FimT